MDGPGFGIKRAGHGDLFTGELFRGFLVAERVSGFAVVENKESVVVAGAGKGALGVVRAHAHPGVVAGGAHVVGDRAGELLFALRGGDGRDEDEAQD